MCACDLIGVLSYSFAIFHTIVTNFNLLKELVRYITLTSTSQWKSDNGNGSSLAFHRLVALMRMRTRTKPWIHSGVDFNESKR